ncbi:PLP-dependent aminotransferase family protein [Acidocella sp. KAb 2-4]|uniref:MocR-like pyridoxine biosynthesis transcription factor PdxR n=1 Tax=Acidocella sp. KAb 2-4 TaxID=2885158 RepID=UPI001D07CE5A|nr:PLP-dependent aminotransferase family protein [Acidocella sp. KAb 2-4]MCB5943612.1 PLP-dependent aminotransferase family protein [Acidocella sp. KAb 2-4]
MTTIALSDWLLARINRDEATPLHRQLHEALLAAVLEGQLPAGRKLPSSRLLARELGVARNTVIDVYETLGAQGCLETRHGSGTFVADLSAERIAPPGPAPQPVAAPLAPRLSVRGEAVVKGARVFPRQWGAFMPGVPDVTEFPTRVWARLHNRHWNRAPPERLSYAPAGGLPALRVALAEHLRTARGVRCEPEQIVITTGIHQSIDLTARLLTDPGDTVWLEDPCYWGLRHSLQSLGLKLRPVPVDAEGLNWSGTRGAAPRFIVATPSHQYPLGMVMTLPRRQALLEQARAHGSWIVEDDYDSEFRYGTRPITSLQGLDRDGLVIYVGSLSKTLFPGLRMGYIVAPPSLAAAFAEGVAELYREGQLQQQAMLADFIAEGHFAAHIRRMRGLYSRRRQALLEAIHAEFGESLPVMGDNAGLHLVLSLPGLDDRAIAQAAVEAGVATRPLSSYYHGHGDGLSGLLLGYACVREEAIAPAFATLARVLRRFGA